MHNQGNCNTERSKGCAWNRLWAVYDGLDLASVYTINLELAEQMFISAKIQILSTTLLCTSASRRDPVGYPGKRKKVLYLKSM